MRATAVYVRLDDIHRVVYVCCRDLFHLGGGGVPEAGNSGIAVHAGDLVIRNDVVGRSL